MADTLISSLPPVYKELLSPELEKPAAGRFIEAQETLCLPARQTQARHFQELAVDPLEHEVARGLARMSAHDLPSPLKRAGRRPLSNGTGE